MNLLKNYLNKLTNWMKYWKDEETIGGIKTGCKGEKEYLEDGEKGRNNGREDEEIMAGRMKE